MEPEEKLSRQFELLANPTVRRILHKLYEKGGRVSRGEILKELIKGIDTSVGNFYFLISKLQEVDFVKKINKTYELTEDGELAYNIVKVVYDLLIEKGENYQEISKLVAEASTRSRYNPLINIEPKLQTEDEKSKSEIIMEIMTERKRLKKEEIFEQLKSRTGKNIDIDRFDFLLQRLKGTGKLYIDKNNYWCLEGTQ
jgi:DNA-binding transcriptional ArsR family regulator